MAHSDSSRIKAKPSVLIVPGAFHTAVHYSSLIDLLETRGFETVCVDLPSAGGGVDSDLQGDVDAITTAVERMLGQSDTVSKVSETMDSHDARDILVVAHSRGGAPATQAITASQTRYTRALRNLGGGVVHLLYMCAFAPFPGESVVTCFAGIRAPVKVLSDGTLLPVDAATQFYHDIPLDQQQHYNSFLIPTAGKPARQVMTNAAYLHVPVTYIVCEDDRMLGPSTQRWMVEGMRLAGGDVKEISMFSSHSPFLSRTKEVVDVIEKIVEELQSFEGLRSRGRLRMEELDAIGRTAKTSDI